MGIRYQNHRVTYDNVDIRMVAFREQPETPEDAYEKELTESKMRHRVRLNHDKEHMHEHMAHFHARRKPNLECNSRIGRDTRESRFSLPVRKS